MKKHVLVLVGVALVTVFFSGCQSQPGAGSSTSSEATTVAVDTSTEKPLEAGPDVTARAITSIDVSESVPAGGADQVSLALDPDDIVIEEVLTEAAVLQAISGNMTVSFIISDSAGGDACTNGASAADFTVEVTGGRAIAVEPPLVIVTEAVRDIMLGGEFDLCVQVQASFRADVIVEQVQIEFEDIDANDNGSLGGDNGNDNGDDSNSNDDGGDNGNDNGDDDANDGDDDNANDDDGDNGNDNGGDDDNANDDDDSGGNGNTNDNSPDDDNSNGNGDGDGNSNSDDNGDGNANGNDNSAGDDNGNTNDNGSMNGNGNGNSGEDGNMNGNDNNNGDDSGNDNMNGNENTNGNDNSADDDNVNGIGG